MNIKYVKGDLFSTAAPAIVHGCNAQGVMGSGVAKIIRERYPEAYKCYREAYCSATDKHLSALPLGDVYPAYSNDKLIINAITQCYYGRDGKRYCSYDAIDEAMQNVNNLCRYRNITSVAMPKIGAGLGGGHWTVIEQIINYRLTAAQATVYVL